MSEIRAIVIKKGDQLSSNAKHSENWMVIPLKDQLFVYAQREQEVDDRLSTTAKIGWCLQSTVVQVLARLPDANDMGLVCVYVPDDADTAKIARLLQELVKVAEPKSFNVTSMTVPYNVEECLLAFGVEASASNRFSAAQFKPVSVQ
jgi:hypothetical protein